MSLLFIVVKIILSFFICLWSAPNVNIVPISDAKVEDASFPFLSVLTYNEYNVLPGYSANIDAIRNL